MPLDLATRQTDADAAAVAGLDALDTPTVVATAWWRRALAAWLPPLVALVLFIAVWQVIWASAIRPEFKLPAPAAVWAASSPRPSPTGRCGRSSGPRSAARSSGSRSRWSSPPRSGLLVARVRVVRAAIGPLLSGLQSLPSVAWVPAAVLWFGLPTPRSTSSSSPAPSRRSRTGWWPASTRSRRSCRGWARCSGRRRAHQRAPHPAAGRAARLPGRLQAGLGVLLALPDGRGDHRRRAAARVSGSART